MALWRATIFITLLCCLIVVTGQNADQCNSVNMGVMTLSSNQSSPLVSLGDVVQLSCEMRLDFNLNNINCNAAHVKSVITITIGTGEYTSYVVCYYTPNDTKCHHVSTSLAPLTVFKHVNYSDGTSILRNYTASKLLMSENTVKLMTEYKIPENSMKDPQTDLTSDILYTCEFKSDRITKSMTKLLPFRHTGTGLTLSVPHTVEYGDYFMIQCRLQISYYSYQSLLANGSLEISIRKRSDRSRGTVNSRVIKTCARCTESITMVNSWDDVHDSLITCKSSVGFLIQSQPINVKNTIVLGEEVPNVVVNRYNLPTRLDCEHYLLQSGKLLPGNTMKINYTWVIFPYDVNGARTRSNGPVYIHGIKAGPPYQFNAECRAKREGFNQQVIIRVVIVNAYCKIQQQSTVAQQKTIISHKSDVRLGMQLGGGGTNTLISLFNNERFIKRLWVTTVVICLSIAVVSLIIMIFAKYDQMTGGDRVGPLTAVAPLQVEEPKIDSVTVLNDGTVVMDVKNADISRMRDDGARNSLVEQVVEAEDRARNSVLAADLAEQTLPRHLSRNSVNDVLQTAPVFQTSSNLSQTIYPYNTIMPHQTIQPLPGQVIHQY